MLCCLCSMEIQLNFLNDSGLSVKSSYSSAEVAFYLKIKEIICNSHVFLSLDYPCYVVLPGPCRFIPLSLSPDIPSKQFSQCAWEDHVAFQTRVLFLFL